jgi:hypothetical protein
MINNRTMDCVVAAILDHCDDFAGIPTRFAFSEAARAAAGTAIGRKLFALNRRALRERYGAKASGIVLPRYTFTPPAGKISLAQSYKCAACLQYQCAEGNVPESRLYRELDRALGHIAAAIVEASPEYDRAEWGF